jgi:hypothetical protein
VPRAWQKMKNMLGRKPNQAHLKWLKRGKQNAKLV